MRFLCWILRHRWFYTVITHHDAGHLYPNEVEQYRGEWAERLCTRCGEQKADFKRALYNYNAAVAPEQTKPTEYFPLPGDRGMG